MICLGIESTAHTFSIGVVRDDKAEVLANSKSIYVPEKGGIHPAEARDHHDRVKEQVLEDALKTAGVKLDDIDLIAYSAGPGLPPCLRVGFEFAKKLAAGKKLIEVNHCISHIEIGKLMTQCKDPITLYVSGGNTQVIGFASGRYRVFGETQDIAIGNAIDTFIREAALIGNLSEAPRGSGGKYFDELATKGRYIELPYVVKGMDLSFSGILTSALGKFRAGAKLTKSRSKIEDLLCDVCHSFQETSYAMLTEVSERALAHTGKSELLLTGGVAASQRLQDMLKIMCDERNAKLFVCPREFAGDCGAMIAWTGLLEYKSGQSTMSISQADFYQKWRTDEVEVKWL